MPGLSSAENSLQYLPGGVSRLPGIRFETVPARQPAVLPRMDIPVFVGFAGRGPLHIPVPLKDSAEFSEIFGPDQPLAWDTQRGRQEYAYLGPSVRSFFQNGGVRCWVVRVADEYKAHTAFYPLPGLAVFDGAALSPAFAPARSPGSWGEALQVSTALASQSLSLTTFNHNQAKIDLTLPSPGFVIVGDLLRLNYDQDGWFALFPVNSIERQAIEKAPSLDQARAVTLTANQVFWFRPAEARKPASLKATMKVYTQNAPIAALQVTIPQGFWPTDPSSAAAFDYAGVLDPAVLAASDQGSLLQFSFADHSIFWMLVSSQAANDTQPSLPGVGEFERFSGYGVWQMPSPPDLAAFKNQFPRLEKLTFDLAVRSANFAPQRLKDLAFGSEHPQYWAALPNDQDLFTTHAHLTTSDASYPDLLTNPAFLTSAATTAIDPHAALWQSAASPRFPLAGSRAGLLFLPLLIPAFPTFFANPSEPAGDALTRDGLDSFDASLFLDSALAGQTNAALLDIADSLRYLQANPRPLRGIFAALSVSEATVVCVPDAVHNRWEKGLLDPMPPPQPSPPPERPVWWRFLPCNPRPHSFPRTSQPEWGQFLRCGLRIIPAPVLSITQPDQSGTFTLSWTKVVDVDRYVVDESPYPDFRSFHTIYDGPDTGLTLFGYIEGDYYFRLRAEADAKPDGLVETSDYSNSVGLRISPDASFLLWEDNLYTPNTLLAVHRCLLRLCSARGDLFALLSLPRHFRSAPAIACSQALRSPLDQILTVNIPNIEMSGSLSAVDILPISYGEAGCLAFGALYHPWVVTIDGQSQEVRIIPPDGPAAGVLAHRSLQRGAWIAPANEKLHGVVGLQPVISADDWLDIQEAHINLFRDEAQGYLSLSANTLSADPDWILINVRRLISLLRRLALRYGPNYVFEPNSPAFRRTVQREFSAIMGLMLARGAFAGDTPETSFQVNVSALPQDIDAGRLVIELRVAPSVPMRFILVRLVQSGDQSAITEASAVLGAAGG